MAVLTGTSGSDRLVGGADADTISGLAGDDVLIGNGGDDTLSGGEGADRISGGDGNDVVNFNVLTDGGDSVNLGTGYDTFNVNTGGVATTVRLGFINGAVGDGDGSLSITLQALDANGAGTGAATSVDDEGTVFIGGDGVSFDVRGDESQDGPATYGVAYFGTAAGDTVYFTDIQDDLYANGGQGNDRIYAGSGNDLLVGGAGNDKLYGGAGSDTFIGGVGRDAISGGDGDDLMYFNAQTDSRDRANLGTGNDLVLVSAPSESENTQIRLTFTSSEVGNDNAADSNTLANQDGGLAVRLQVEGPNEELTGAVARFDDEGIFFSATVPGQTFDVRDLPSGVSRGDQFVYVGLGTGSDDVADFSDISGNAYGNGGMGNDTITTGTGRDFLVGGAGDDILNGGGGTDSLLGGSGADTFVFDNEGATDQVLDFVSGTDKIDLSAFEISSENVQIVALGDNTQVRVDTDGNGSIDFRVLVVGATVAAGDFVF